MLCLIFASSVNHVIGVNGKLPWHLPGDLKMFRKLTLGKKVIMGRKTYESLPFYPNALPGRENIVVSLSLPESEHYRVARDIDELLTECLNSDEEYWVVGGAELYEWFAPYADKIIHTRVYLHIDTSFEEDMITYFKLPKLTNYTLTTENPTEVRPQDPVHCFHFYERN